MTVHVQIRGGDDGFHSQCLQGIIRYLKYVLSCIKEFLMAPWKEARSETTLSNLPPYVALQHEGGGGGVGADGGNAKE